MITMTLLNIDDHYHYLSQSLIVIVWQWICSKIRVKNSNKVGNHDAEVKESINNDI